MKKNIVILGSTGSIGQNTLKIIKLNKNDFDITLLSTNKNINKIFLQAKEFKVKNIIITDYQSYLIALKKYKTYKFKIYNKFDSINKILNKKKIHYSMVAVSGLDILDPVVITSSTFASSLSCAINSTLNMLKVNANSANK